MSMIGIVMTRGFGLKIWEEKGLLYRELDYLEEYRKRLDIPVLEIISHERNDIDIPNKYHNITISKPIYSGLLYREIVRPFIYFIKRREVSLIRSNQTDVGFWLIVAKLFGKKVVYRSGYSKSEFLHLQDRFFVSYLTLLFERASARLSDIVICAKRSDILRLKVQERKSRVILNYITPCVDSGLNLVRDIDYLFVGRLERQKNLFNLVEAFNILGEKLVIIGEGSLRDDLVRIAKDNIIFKGGIANNEVQNYMLRSKYFILPSYYEGTPKALLEAAYARCQLLVSPSPGIIELFEDNKLQGNLLDSCSSGSIVTGVRKMSDDSTSCTDDNYKWVISNSLLISVVEKEVMFTKRLLDESLD